MNPSESNYRWRVERESEDRIKIVKDLKKKKYLSALKRLSHYDGIKTTTFSNSEDSLGEYFILIHSAFAHFNLNQHEEARTCLKKVLHRQPLDGQANLFLAYLNLLEDDKAEAIHRYTILLENPFYRSQATKILDQIRYSESMTDLLTGKFPTFFYRHQFPSTIKEEIRIFKTKILYHVKRWGLKLTSNPFPSNKSQSSVSRKNSRLYPRRKWIIIFGFCSAFLIVPAFYFKDMIIPQLWKIGFPFFFQKNIEIFTPNLLENYGEEEIEKWISLYRDMEKMINLRQVNLALKIYNTISRDEDLPIEVRNKFYILSTFISPPLFEELDATTSFADIPLEEVESPSGFYYKLTFRIVQMSQRSPKKILVELVNYKKSEKSLRSSLPFSANRAILLGVINDEKITLKRGTVYETIAQLQYREKKYLIFTTVVIRLLQGTTSG